MHDPLSPHLAPPRRYLLDSDSSDEEGQGVYTSLGEPSRHRSTTHPDLPVQLTWTSGGSSDYTNAIIGVGQAGRYLLRTTGAGQETTTPVLLSQGGRVRGRGYELDGQGGKGRVLLLVVEEGEVRGEGDFEVSQAILGGINASEWTILSTYLPSTYIPSSSTALPADPPVRFLAPSPSQTAKLGYAGALPLEPPNYATGLAAALLSIYAHPASPISQPATSSASLLLLPLPLSSLPASSLSPLIPLSLSHPFPESLDEPYAAPGSGRTKLSASQRPKPDHENLSMYT